MRIALFLILSLLWLVLLSYVAAYALILFFGDQPKDVAEASSLVRLVSIVLAVITVAVGMAARFLRLKFFWKTSPFDLRGIGAVSLYLFLSALIPITGLLATLILYAPRFMFGEFLMPVVGVLVGCLFLVLSFPVVPSDKQPLKSEAR